MPNHLLVLLLGLLLVLVLLLLRLLLVHGGQPLLRGALLRRRLRCLALLSQARRPHVWQNGVLVVRLRHDERRQVRGRGRGACVVVAPDLPQRGASEVALVQHGVAGRRRLLLVVDVVYLRSHRGDHAGARRGRVPVRSGPCRGWGGLHGRSVALGGGVSRLRPGRRRRLLNAPHRLRPRLLHLQHARFPERLLVAVLLAVEEDLTVQAVRDARQRPLEAVLPAEAAVQNVILRVQQDALSREGIEEKFHASLLLLRDLFVVSLAKGRQQGVALDNLKRRRHAGHVILAFHVIKVAVLRLRAPRRHGRLLLLELVHLHTAHPLVERPGALLVRLEREVLVPVPDAGARVPAAAAPDHARAREAADGVVHLLLLVRAEAEEAKFHGLKHAAPLWEKV
mmetsp:Transcript_21790/g.66724  ORF Transcript_21790/g.66724 Transcript_21790/m.66724 type:complete len:396 (-) Transcript_21790:684-1871(-)